MVAILGPRDDRGPRCATGTADDATVVVAILGPRDDRGPPGEDITAARLNELRSSAPGMTGGRQVLDLLPGECLEVAILGPRDDRGPLYLTSPFAPRQAVS